MVLFYNISGNTELNTELWFLEEIIELDSCEPLVTFS